jgi:hypothetical protein
MATTTKKKTGLPGRPRKDDSIQEKSQLNFNRQARVVSAIDAYLSKRTIERGRRFTVQEMAEEMGLDHAQNLVGIRTGTRYIADMNQIFVRKLAKVLCVSPVTLYQMAEFITPEDLYFEDDLPTRTEQSYKKMCSDLSNQDIVPTSSMWHSWPQSARDHFAMLYEFHTLHTMELFTRLKKQQGKTK